MRPYANNDCGASIQGTINKIVRRKKGKKETEKQMFVDIKIIIETYNYFQKIYF